jgi:hypothetical protein
MVNFLTPEPSREFEASRNAPHTRPPHRVESGSSRPRTRSQVACLAILRVELWLFDVRRTNSGRDNAPRVAVIVCRAPVDDETLVTSLPVERTHPAANGQERGRKLPPQDNADLDDQEILDNHQR